MSVIPSTCSGALSEWSAPAYETTPEPLWHVLYRGDRGDNTEMKDVAFSPHGGCGSVISNMQPPLWFYSLLFKFKTESQTMEEPVG